MINTTITSLGKNPINLISEMRSQLNEMIARSFKLKKTEEMHKCLNQLQDLYLKLNMVELTYDKKLIAITGLQGVGKTKIVRDLYEFSDELLPSDGGRGEVLPVLFTESKDVQAPAYIVRRAVKNEETSILEVKDIPVPTEVEFNRIAMFPEINDLWLEIIVPLKYFFNNTSLLLLPGFEKDRRQGSQKYLSLLLTFSTSILLVFNHKKLAQNNQQLLISMIADDYKDVAPIFAVSFSEELQHNERNDIKQDIQNKFQLLEDDVERIIFTGTSEEFKEYPEQIVNAIHRFCLTNAIGYQKQLSLLGELASDIETTAIEFENEIQQQRIFQQSGQNNNSQLQLSEIHQVFTEYRNKTTKEVQKKIDTSLSNYVGVCNKKMEDLLSNEKVGVLKKIKKAFNADVSYAERSQLKKQITDIWGGTTHIEPEKRLISSLDIFVKERNKLMPQVKVLTIESDSNKPKKAIQLFEKPTTGASGSLENLDRYLNGDIKDLSITLKREDLEFLPILAVGMTQELIASSMFLEETAHLDKLSEGERSEIIESHTKLIDEINEISSSTRDIMRAGTIFFGIDVLDGKMDSFGALEKLLEKVGVSTAAVGGPVAALIIGAIGSSLAVYKGTQRIEKYKFDRDAMARQAFSEIASIQADSVVETVNNLLDIMEDKLSAVYRDRAGIDENFGLMDELTARSNRLQISCRKLEELAFRNGTYIG